MRVIVAGSRGITDKTLIEAAIASSGLTIDVEICGCAIGADLGGWAWARANQVPVEFHPAWKFQWEWARREAKAGEIVHDCSQGGRAAGFVRNAQMARCADALIAIWDGESTGTKGMIATMSKLNKPFYVLNCRLKEAWPGCECGGVAVNNASGEITRTCIRCGKIVQRPLPVFTADEVLSLNAFQHSGCWHPFTCGNEHEGQRPLIATPSGWVCLECDYRQDWAHDFMKNWAWKSQVGVMNELKKQNSKEKP